MLNATKRAAIRRAYRLLRLTANKTQIEVEQGAQLLSGRYWKFENGVSFPDAVERKRLAKVLRCAESAIPSEPEVEAKAS